MCYKTRKANEVYRYRIGHVKAVAEHKAQVQNARMLGATSWTNPLARAAAYVPEDTDDMDIEPVSEKKLKWKLSALVAPTLTRAALDSAARRIGDSGAHVKHLRRLTGKTPRFMLTTVGTANRDQEVITALAENSASRGEEALAGSGGGVGLSGVGRGGASRRGLTSGPGRPQDPRSLQEEGGRVAVVVGVERSRGGGGGPSPREEIDHQDASSEETSDAVPEGWSWREDGSGAVVWISPDGQETEEDPRSGAGT